MSVSRREFLEAAGLGSLSLTALQAAPDARTGMPQRVLGRTGATVSVLAFGCGSRLLAYGDRDKALAAVTRALDGGINYLDTAYGYGNGKSESWIGELMPARRKSVWLTTKVQARSYDEAMRSIEGSLQRLKTDQVDLLHIHSLTSADDLAAIERKGGVLEAVYKARSQKLARFIGVTSHTDPIVLRDALERHDFDCTQMALNAARVGMASGAGGFALGDPARNSFETAALPVARRKNMGVIAMKVFAQEKLVGKAPADRLVRYSLSLPVTAVVIGMPDLSLVDSNLTIAKGFQPMPRPEMDAFARELSGEKAELDRFFLDHADA